MELVMPISLLISRLNQTLKGRRFPPLALAQIALAESTLGFELPPTLKSIYTEVGNGGFGPGQGLLRLVSGVAGGFPTETAVDWYLEQCKYKVTECDSWDEQNPECFWMKGLLPICDWGCGIFSSVHCQIPGFPVVRHDPNVEFGDVKPLLKPHQVLPGAQFFYAAMWVEALSFDEWIAAWLDGENLFQTRRW